MVRLQVDDLQSLLAPAAEDHGDFLSARRKGHRKRHASQIDGLPDGVNPQPRRQETRVVGDRSGLSLGGAVGCCRKSEGGKQE